MPDVTGPPATPRPPQAATVVACYGRHLRLRLDGGAVALARPARRGLEVVCGDAVDCEHDPQHRELRVIAVQPRRTTLYRTDARGRSELVAANVDLLLVVVAALPPSDLFVADRYLAAAASGGMDAAVVANKCDLPADAGFEAGLAGFRLAGYAVFHCSARSGLGLEPLLAAIGRRTAMLAGQSGVGKSSLTRALVPESDAEVGELTHEAAGRHTTTTARLYELAGGGRLLDAPGVRDFSPAVQHLEPAALGFVEVARWAPQCRFSDCRHLHEPDCAVRAASAHGAMDPRRYESYRRLRRLSDALAARQPGRPRR
jgi:ribosome biogenesis GTPase